MQHRAPRTQHSKRFIEQAGDVIHPHVFRAERDTSRSTDSEASGRRSPSNSPNTIGRRWASQLGRARTLRKPASRREGVARPPIECVREIGEARRYASRLVVKIGDDVKTH